MLGSAIAPLIQWGFIGLLVMGAIWFIGKSAVRKHKLKQAERHNKAKDKQRENLANQPRTRDELDQRVRNNW